MTEDWYHLEYNGATAISPACTITILRDPVERFLSEYNMLRGGEQRYPFQDQWDWHEDDFRVLGIIQQAKNGTRALLAALNSDRNPSRNRQALYLLGFTRVKCGRWCCRVCSRDEPYGYPARAYDWDADHSALVARSKQRLMSLRAFGITDCLADSARVMAGAMGWDPNRTAALVLGNRERQQINRARLSLLAEGLGARQEAVALSRQAQTSELRWSQALPRWLRAEIQGIHAVDMELVAFAKQQLYERYGIRCGA